MDEIIGLLLYFFFDVLFVYTGEVVRYIFSFGRYEPRFKGRQYGFNWLSFFIGLIFWIIVGTLINIYII